jgi:hypothetical protein
LPQGMDLPVIVGGRRRPRRIHRLLLKLCKLPRDQLLSRRRALGLLSLPRHFADQNWQLEEWPWLNVGRPVGDPRLLARAGLMSGDRLNWTRSDIKNWTPCEERRSGG